MTNPTDESLLEQDGATATITFNRPHARNTAKEAVELGLASEVLAPDRLEPRVHEIADGLTELAPLTLRATKEALRRIQASRRLAPGDGEDLILSCYMSEDFRGAVQAFLDKRNPTWTGR